jgi:hypothetical protein
MVVGRDRREIATETESTCDVDGVKSTDVDWTNVTRFRNDARVKRHNRSGRENTLQNNAAVDHRIGAFYPHTSYRPRQLNFGDDARR